MTPDEEIASLRAEDARQRERIAALVARVRELEGRLAKDSHTSGKPPSSDGLARKTRSRRRSGKRPGGQMGHHSETLRLVATPDTAVEHRPAVCNGCQRPLAAEAIVVRRNQRQVRDLPLPRLRVTEHQALHM